MSGIPTWPVLSQYSSLSIAIPPNPPGSERSIDSPKNPPAKAFDRLYAEGILSAIRRRHFYRPYAEGILSAIRRRHFIGHTPKAFLSAIRRRHFYRPYAEGVG